MNRTWSVSLAASLAALFALTARTGAETAPAREPSPRAAEAMRLLDSEDLYQRQVGFLRLEALREPATLEKIRSYLDHKNPEVRAYSLRAVAAIEGAPAIPQLLRRLQAERQPRVRRAALLGLEPMIGQDPAVLPALLVALRDRSTEVRMAAVDVVSRIDDPKAREAIRLRHRREWRRDVRRVLQAAIQRVGP